jgi:hypothetical protein
MALRNLFCSAEYKNSFIARVRNTIGAHYNADEIARLIEEHVDDDDLLESTAASVGGLARMADPIVRGILNILNGGDFMVDEEHAERAKDSVLGISRRLITVVDHFFDALMREHMGAIVWRSTRRFSMFRRLSPEEAHADIATTANQTDALPALGSAGPRLLSRTMLKRWTRGRYAVGSTTSRQLPRLTVRPCGAEASIENGRSPSRCP